MRKVKEEKGQVIEISKDIKVGDYILEKGDKIRILNERKFNSGFTGFYIADATYREAKGIEFVFDEYGIDYDKFSDHGYIHFVTDIQDLNTWQKIVKEIERKTGMIVYDYEMNR